MKTIINRRRTAASALSGVGAISLIIGAIVLILINVVGTPLAAACGPGNNCTPNTYISKLQFGATVMGTGSGNAPIVSATQGTITVNYYVPSGESILSSSMVYCTSLTNGACPSASSYSIPLTQGQGNFLTGSFTAPTGAATSGNGAYYYFIASITDSDGFTQTLLGVIQYAPGSNFGSVNVTANAPGAMVEFFGANNQEVAQITTAPLSAVAVSLRYGSYTWTAIAANYTVTEGSVTVNSANVPMTITMQQNNAPATTTTTTVITGITTCINTIVNDNGLITTTSNCAWPVSKTTTTGTNGVSTTVTGSTTSSAATKTSTSISTSASAKPSVIPGVSNNYLGDLVGGLMVFLGIVFIGIDIAMKR